MTRELANEDDAVREVVERLSERFPEMQHDAISAAVDEARHRFDSAKVRDFVPVLIEREARARLEHPI